MSKLEWSIMYDLRSLPTQPKRVALACEVLPFVQLGERERTLTRSTFEVTILETCKNDSKLKKGPAFVLVYTFPFPQHGHSSLNYRARLKHRVQASHKSDQMKTFQQPLRCSRAPYLNSKGVNCVQVPRMAYVQRFLIRPDIGGYGLQVLQPSLR